MSSEQEQRIAELTKAANSLIEEVDEMNESAGTQLVTLTLRAKRNRMMIWGLSISLFLDVVLTAFMISLTREVSSAEQLTRNQVLCPLYQQFVNSDTPQSRALAKKVGQDMKARAEAFRVIHKSYNALECEGVKKP